MHACIHTWLPTYVHTYLHSYRHTHENIHVDLCWFIYVCILRHHLKWCFFLNFHVTTLQLFNQIVMSLSCSQFFWWATLLLVFSTSDRWVGDRWPHRLHRPHPSFVISLNAELRGDVFPLVHVELPQQIRSEGLWILEKKGEIRNCSP